MRVILPDGKELELPEGATGLDAARAIGPKLAEQAVLVRTSTASSARRGPIARAASSPVAPSGSSSSLRSGRMTLTMAENTQAPEEQDPEPTDVGSPVPDPESDDTNAEDIPSAD